MGKLSMIATISATNLAIKQKTKKAYNSLNYMPFLTAGGVDGARTRDHRRDRPVF